jgi:acetyl esterase/lipase
MSRFDACLIFASISIGLGFFACDTDDTTVPAATGETNVGGGGGAGGMNTGGQTASTGGNAGMGGQGGEPMPIELARCGLDYDWLPSTSVGAVVSNETPHSTLTVPEALVTKIALQLSGLSFNRDPGYETLAHRITYTTQDRGTAREATSLVVVPQVTTAESFPVLVFHHGTTGHNDLCAPTYMFEDSNSPQFDVALLLSMFSSFGYIVVAPDYLGQKSVGAPSPSLHPYLIGEPTAVAAWDAVRATQQLLAGDASSADFGPIALWGASQGGHAAMYTAMYQSSYAPEMDLRTGVYAVPPSDLQAHMMLGTRDLRSSTGNVVLFYTAADAWYQPAISPGLSQIFVPPYDTQLPTDLAAECSPSTLDNITSVDQVFTSELIAASQTSFLSGYEPWGCFMRENSVPTSSLPAPTIPGMFLLGENDTLVWTGIERAAFDTLCAQGHQLTYRECAGAGHEEGFFWAIDDALDYIDARLAGTPVSGSCVKSPPQTCSNTP